MLDITLALLLTLLALTSWAANIFGMPGNWFLVLMAGVCFYLRAEDSPCHVGLAPLIAIVVVAILGEVLEFAASALGASRMGGSKRGTVLAVGGSIAGAIAGLFVGSLIPIPMIGPVIASLLLGASGAFAGAIAGERWVGKDWDSSIQIGSAAFWGRLLGTVGKAVCGTIAGVIFCIAIWW